jgi:hypothetical protein
MWVIRLINFSLFFLSFLFLFPLSFSTSAVRNVSSCVTSSLWSRQWICSYRKKPLYRARRQHESRPCGQALTDYEIQGCILTHWDVVCLFASSFSSLTPSWRNNNRCSLWTWEGWGKWRLQVESSVNVLITLGRYWVLISIGTSTILTKVFASKSIPRY